MVIVAMPSIRTGDPEESPFLNVLPDARTRQALGFMNLPLDTRVTAEVGRDLCQRQQLKALLTGQIASVGNNYAVTLQAVDCQTGDSIAQELVEVSGKEQVLAGVGRATSEMRERLGESLASIQKLDTPIQQATTSSLEALKALVSADALRAQGQRDEALAMFKRALDVDPDFALAHARIGALYDNMAERALSISHRTRAFELRERASERERFYIESSYYLNVGFDPVKSRATYEQWRQTYPRDATPLNNLGAAEAQAGRFDRAIDLYRAAVALDPALELFHANLVDELDDREPLRRGTSGAHRGDREIRRDERTRQPGLSVGHRHRQSRRSRAARRDGRRRQTLGSDGCGVGGGSGQDACGR